MSSVVDPTSLSPSDRTYETNFLAAKTNFPSATTFTKIPFHSIFEYAPDMKQIMLEYAGPGFVDDASRSNEERLTAFRSTITSATSRKDLDSVLLTRLVVAYAKHIACEAILWGDSDSRLAAKTLAGAAKGRGASLTWQVSDGMSPWGVRFEFPLRGLSKPELLQYAGISELLEGVIIPEEPISDNILTKNLSIDDLMMRYVVTQGEKYRGVMANVSRTANKLEPAKGVDDQFCSLCGALTGNVKGNDAGLTVASQFGNSQGSFCYGCIRSRPEVIP
ncbi:hypothetical protein N7470_002659 [Penicillium chermesinum]|nr:hypothetical protein N7470_002659 [Penicillium chermesinum]